MGIIDEKITADILRSAKISASPDEVIELAARLEEIRGGFLGTCYVTSKDDRGRAKGTMGEHARNQLMGDMYGFWVCCPGVEKLPTASFYEKNGERGGSFICMVQRFCKAIADSIDPADSKAAILISGLRQMARSGDAVYKALLIAREGTPAKKQNARLLKISATRKAANRRRNAAK